MSLLKDVYEDNKDYRFKTKVIKLVSPREWFYHHKWRKQRADRGWSNRDTWGAGDHIAKITAEMLQHLNDYTYVDWPEWFKLNVKEEGENAYTSLPQVTKDITTYLDFAETSWADGLTTKRDSIDETFKERADGNYEYKSPDWYEENKKLSEAAISHRIKKWSKEERRLFKKAANAMQFFGRHFTQFWD